MVSDHDQSDRNGDGYDSPTIWNNLLEGSNFGLTFNLNNYSQTSTSIITDPADSVINGPYGHVTQVLWSNGTDMTIDPALNPTLKGVVFKNGYLGNNTKIMFAYGRCGRGKIAAMGDSSPADDGTGDDNDNLYNGYTSDANGNHQKLIMNATIWLLAASIPSAVTLVQNNNLLQLVYFDNALHVNQKRNLEITLSVVNENGQTILHKELNIDNDVIDLSYLKKGIYLANAIDSNGSRAAIKIIKF